MGLEAEFTQALEGTVEAANLPAPAILAAEIVEDLQAALEQFKGIEDELGSD